MSSTEMPAESDKSKTGKIARGRGSMASQSPRLIDIARKVGVSVQTVSLVLKGAEGVGPVMRERIQKEVQKMGYRRNRFAAKFFSKKTKTFGVVVPRLAESWLGSLVEELHHSAVNIGFDTEIFLTNYDSALEEKVLEDLVGMRVDGIVLVSKYWRLRDVPMTHFVRASREDGPRVPLVTNNWIIGSKVPAIVHDIFHGTREVVSYLISKGHRQLAFLGVVNETVERATSYRYRVGGFRRAIRDSGLPASAGAIVTTMISKSDQITPAWNSSRTMPENTKSAHKEFLKKIMEMNPRPTAVVCSNDALAASLVRSLQSAGINVPGDMAVVGCDDTYYAEMSSVPLTTISFDIKTQAQQMVAELLSFQHPDYRPPRERKILPRVIIRESA